ncbi:DUF5908 family protein [Candidatus Electronema sp. PJ]|uniref:DUF5908 family protein n=1 Tax=Candidatus Electronema sp. PJ TaxID=3401572 RepID=UPI003AA90FD1
MSIEVRQLIVKTIIEKNQVQDRADTSRDDTEQLKTELFNQCRGLIAEIIRREKER